ncbi:MAG TPA: ArsA family ATPase [Acidimicrobiia bacterium]
MSSNRRAAGNRFDQRSLILISGKGGVGKSAVTAAVALHAHRRGQRVLAIDVMGTGGLAVHLGVDRLEFRARAIRPGLEALAIDRAKALAEYLKVQMGIPQFATLGPVARAFDALASTAPGVREVITLGKVLWEVRQDQYDLVVADCPPTGQLAGFLKAPTTIAQLVPAGRIRAQADWMTDLLSSRDRSEVFLVTIPEELPTVEAMETIEQLDKDDVVGEPTVVANRVLTPLPTEAKGTGAVADAATLHRSLVRNQREWLGRLPPKIRLPFLFGLMTPGEVSARMADELESELGQ